ncbi:MULTISPECIES: hypothetical protein [Pseudomonas]|uniref:hypothetical protein n=1 Tax=Pseudomonas TaxID=286 RepID=UPI0015954EAE|nr:MULTISPECIES: hypothetical protein [Pseudomonas]
MPSSNFSLESPPATKAQLAALMQNILDDVVNLQAPCPTGPAPDLTAMELADCYRLAWQLLVTGVDIPATRRLVAAIAGKGSATAEQTVQFKFMRARFKKMRFACANYSEQHAYPESLDSITRLMGRFQDAFKNGQRYRTLWLGIRLWCRLRDGFFAGLRIPRHLDTQPTIIWTLVPCSLGHLIHVHLDRQSERSDAGLHC